jgi:hypothetical protein
MVQGASCLKMGEVSHTLLLLQRGDEWFRRTVVPITPAVEMALRDQLRKETQAEQLRLYHSLTNVEGSGPWSSRLASVVYDLLEERERRQLSI